MHAFHGRSSVLDKVTSTGTFQPCTVPMQRCCSTSLAALDGGLLWLMYGQGTLVVMGLLNGFVFQIAAFTSIFCAFLSYFLPSGMVLPPLSIAVRVPRYFTNVFNDKDAVERAYVVRRTGARAGGG